MTNYDDIIHLPHWEPHGRKRMSMESRAAQFAPFAALKEGETTKATDVSTEDICRSTKDME